MDDPGRLWIDGVLTPTRSATLTIGFPDPARGVWAGAQRRSRPVEPKDATYELVIEIDERSGEDMAARPTIQTIPVWIALGGRHPSFAELGSLDLAGIGEDADWDAWFGNDAPQLTDNRLLFEGWDGPCLRVLWMARSHDGLALAEWRGPGGEPRVGTGLRFEGRVRFMGLTTNVQRTEDAEAFIRSVWGETQFSMLERIEQHRVPAQGVRPPSVNLRYVLRSPPRP